MKIFREYNIIGRLLLASLIVMGTVVGSVPATAKADTPPIELSFSGNVSTRLIANNIRPGESGTKIIPVQNTGTESGILTIWLSDIINTEGLNPESETGDITGPGELGSYLTLDISVDGLSTNVDMPVKLKDFPTSYNSTDYIEIIPFKSGEIKDISLHWELPADTDNEVQGDELSFTINYLLQETVITDITGNTNPEGELLTDVLLESEDKKGKILIKATTKATTSENQTPDEIWIVEIDNDPPPPPDGKTSAGEYYDAGPDGTTFSQPLTITLEYLPESIPTGVSEMEIYIAIWNETTKQWDELPNCIVNTGANTVTTDITHFSCYTVLCRQPAAPPNPPPPQPAYPDYPPPPVAEDEEDEPITVEVSLFNDSGVAKVAEDGTVLETLILEGPDGDFVIEIKAGVKITDTDGNPLSRLDLELSERPLTLPDGTVILTPVFDLTGYDSEGNLTDIIFDPPAFLSIHYRARDLPENSLLPFLATYTEEDGVVPLEFPYGALVDLGWAQAFIREGGLYFAAAEVAPFQLPLPPDFTASNLVINPDHITQGETVRISATIANEGEESGSYELYLIIDGVVRVIREINLMPTSSETMTFEISNLTSGSHVVEIAHLQGNIFVEHAESGLFIKEVNWLAIDLSVGGTVVFGILVWLFFMRRTRRRTRENKPYLQ